MARITIRPTRADRALADTIAAHTDPSVEAVSRLLTWGADEKLLLAAAVAAWTYALPHPRLRPLATHFLAASIVATIVPHLLKKVVDQTRPDRLTIFGHWRGVPFSGRARDAFPSGHAVHIGALASAAGLLPRRDRRLTRATAVVLAATRVVLLAHWASDVIAGFVLGGILERLLRRLTLNNMGRP